ncbi:MAG: four helix bundle protein [Lentisphaerae bacterium]|nr:four helix bundle protein [Lentisphaerota bacterium]
MASIETFEDIEAWQESRKLANAVYAITRRNGFDRDFGLRDQIQRAAVSVVSNIAEGFERGSNKEFIQFLYISKGSVGEVRAQLYVALDQQYISAAEHEELSASASRVSRMIAGLISYLLNSDYKGSKR